MNDDATSSSDTDGREPLELSITGPGMSENLSLTNPECMVGRALESDLQLPDAAVSRRHARFVHDGTSWCVEDLGSRHGTEIGGARIPSERPVPVSPGERIVIRPYVIRVTGDAQERTTIFAKDDSDTLLSDSVAAVPESELEVLASRRLGLLMDSAASIQQAIDVGLMGSAAIDAILAGTEFGRAFVLAPVGGSVEQIEIISSRARIGASEDTEQDPISRTLLRAAESGRVVRLRDEPDIQAAVSIVGAGVKEALCVPIRVGEGIEAYLYLDASASSGSDGSDTAAFCSAIGRLCGLAMANIERIDLQTKQARLVQELQAAQMVQKRMAPPESGAMCGVKWELRVVPGTIVAGDLVGACSTPDDTPIVFLGDVAGKGAAAGLLMAALEARLIAESERGTDVGQMICNANNAIMRVTDAAEFITLWTVSFDRAAGTATCVDAGHGYCAIVRADGGIEQVQIDGGPPVGVVPNFPYEGVTVPFHPGDRMVIFSDGLAEQQGPDKEMFNFERVIDSLGKSTGEQDDVNRLYDALEAFAGPRPWQDDVTIMSVSFDEGA